MSNLATPPDLSFARMDIEKRIGFPAGRYTQAGPVLPLLLAALVTVGFYAALVPLRGRWIAQTFTERGDVPYFTMSFVFWALMILVIKSRKVALQRRAVRVSVMPEDPEFLLTPGSAKQVIDRIYAVCDDPSRFMLLNRILLAISTLRNLGHVADVDQVLRSQAENDEATIDSSYTVVKALIWAIPVWGFIGTVLGLSDAIAAFSSVLRESTEIATLKPALQLVTAGLATAFETTLQALVAAVFLQMYLTLIKRREEQMLDDFIEYCQQKIVRRLRTEAPRPEEVADAAAVAR